jgi:oligopeptidase A
LLGQNKAILNQLLEHNTVYSWDNLVVPLEEMEDRLNKFWSPVRHLHCVADNEELRKAYNICLEKITAYSTDILQDHSLYLAYSQLAESEQFKQLDTAQKKVIENALREFRLSGVGLEQALKDSYKHIVQELSSIQSKFEENVLDATHGWSMHITDLSRLDGLPDSALDLAKKNAAEHGLEAWLITLDFPSYYPVMQYADDRSLRQEMYEAYATRASDQGPADHQWDNGPLLEKILKLRSKQASLLGFKTYADYSLARKMAKTPDEVLGFLYDLVTHSISAAKAEFRVLSEYANRHHNLARLYPWDVTYYSEKLRQHKFDFTQEELKPYFPAAGVISGLFKLVNRLYGLNIDERDHIDVWHPDVQYFDITDVHGKLRGSFYLDLYARRHKRGGAWMDECIVRKKLGTELQHPVAYLSCNFTPPVDGRPSLLTHDEVTTLFHEFGHGLHHMLTLVDYPPVSGINGVPWDAVELPSQFMENWCWEKESLDDLAKHHLTGDLLPETLFDKLVKAKNFQSAMQMVRQLEFSIFDFRLHYEENDYTQQSIQHLLDEIRAMTAVITPPAYNRFQNSFTHVFSGGYAAGYYSYKWAEVLSADAFSKFEENGIFDRTTGEQFLHSILEQGGSREPMDLFVEFRGRKPSIGPLLRHAGIVKSEQAENVT